MTMPQNKKVALVTGAAGFIGFHISKRLLNEDWRVVGVDCMSDYYDRSLKEHRESILLQNPMYRSVHALIEAPSLLLKLFEEERPEVVIHLAAQAGVRHSIENPRAYLESNIVGTFELLEAARAFPPVHLLLASTSSAYGVNQTMHYKETDKTDYQIYFYAATKKSTENMAHSYAHLFEIPVTVFRFFTVYGPFGRPDMALFKFTKSILSGEEIDVYNFGEMYRDFTYIDDLIEGVRLLIDIAPTNRETKNSFYIEKDNRSPVAPFRVVNIGSSNPVKLLDFIEAIEDALGIKSKMNLLPMQAGDVSKTWSDTQLLQKLTGYTPKTEILDGVKKFVNWYKSYYSLRK